MWTPALAILVVRTRLARDGKGFLLRSKDPVIRSRITRCARPRSTSRNVRNMPATPSLRDKARDAIRNGKLPAQRAIRTLGGTGTGEICPVCEERIRHDQMELELEFTKPAAAGGSDRYHLHPRCCAAWESERVRIERTM